MSRYADRVVVVTGAARTEPPPPSASPTRVPRWPSSTSRGGGQQWPRPGAARAIGVACNVAEAESVEAAVAKVVDELGKVDVLVNNAGVTRDNLLFKMTDEDWDMAMNVHLRGLFLMTRAVQKMVAAKYGKILNLSSRLRARQPRPGQLLGGQDGPAGLHLTLAPELGPFGINANATAPGFITDMTDDTARRVGVERRTSARRRSSATRCAGRLPRGHRRGRGLPVQRRGLLHHRPDPLRRRWRQGLISPDLA